MLGQRRVVDEVRNRVTEPGNERDLDQTPLEEYRCGDQQDAESQVQSAVVPHEVLVVRTQSRDPVSARKREMLIERAGERQGPEASVKCRRRQKQQTGPGPSSTHRVALMSGVHADSFLVVRSVSLGWSVRPKKIGRASCRER